MDSVTLAEVQAFFFKAMVGGWAVGGQKIKIADMPGYKAIPFRDGDLYLLDRYCVVPNSTKSAGTTTIWYKDVPVWVMNYGGSYEESAIKFLKSMLRMAYDSGIFCGGRGSRLGTDSLRDLVYFNRPRLNDFAKFDGMEQIFNTRTGSCLGYHEYWGMSLL